MRRKESARCLVAAKRASFYIRYTGSVRRRRGRHGGPSSLFCCFQRTNSATTYLDNADRHSDGGVLEFVQLGRHYYSCMYYYGRLQYTRTVLRYRGTKPFFRSSSSLSPLLALGCCLVVLGRLRVLYALPAWLAVV